MFGIDDALIGAVAAPVVGGLMGGLFGNDSGGSSTQTTTGTSIPWNWQNFADLYNTATSLANQQNQYAPGQPGAIGGGVGWNPIVPTAPVAPLTDQQKLIMDQIAWLSQQGTKEAWDMAQKLQNLPEIKAATVAPVQLGGATTMAPVSKMTGANIAFPYQQLLDVMAKGDVSNPYVKQMVDAAIRPVQEQYLNTIVPNMTSQAEAAGRYGGSADQLARAQAATDYTRNVGDISSKIYGTTYENAQTRALQAMGLGGQMSAAQAQLMQQANLANMQAELATSQGNAQLAAQYQALAASLEQQANLANAGYKMQAQQQNVQNLLASVPALANTQNQAYNNMQAGLNVGNLQQAQNQAGLTATYNQNVAQQQQPWNILNNLRNIYSAAPGTVTTQQTPIYSPSTASQVASGALTGAALWNMFNQPYANQNANASSGINSNISNPGYDYSFDLFT